MKWISVKDKLPTDFERPCHHDPVLIFANNIFGYGPVYGIAKYDDNKWEILGDAGAYDCEGFYELKSEDVTHWMELPIAPDDIL